ncbi:hypothetical protein DUI87_29143 [Hirundo rustica rustica]|uniref:Uncharacterized protein n=1 Tax=Hirundo rustica rustica TaxID=333673 RepID=A0A3M0IZY4_HIRRU|nr:hypothetical protein DUI87_29143 [Hirundo rustica rustica]
MSRPGRASPQPLRSPRHPGQLVLVHRPQGPPITRRILIRDGRELHIGRERCPSGPRADIALYGRAAVGGSGQESVGAGAGGIAEPHGRHRRSWTLPHRTLLPWGLRHGPDSSERRRGSRGLNLRVLDGGTARPLPGRFRTHLRPGGGRRSAPPWPGSPGRAVAALGDSAARSLTPEMPLLLRELLGSGSTVRPRYRLSWALVGILAEDQLSAAEDKQEYQGKGTTELAIAQRGFLTYDDTRSTLLPVMLSVDGKNNQVKIDGSPLCLYTGEAIDGVDMRAEVGFLTRNTPIQGEMEDSCYGQYECQFFSFDTFGEHIKGCHASLNLGLIISIEAKIWFRIQVWLFVQPSEAQLAKLQLNAEEQNSTIEMLFKTMNSLLLQFSVQN